MLGSDLELPASRDVRKYISVVEAPHSIVSSFGSINRLRHLLETEVLEYSENLSLEVRNHQA